MSSTDVTSDTAAGTAALGIDMKLEVVTLPVSDFDRAKEFYQRLGWRLDIDRVFGPDIRAVQITPPHSECSIQFTKAADGSGSVQGLLLVVDDIDAAREDLVRRGVEVSEVAVQRPPGFDLPEESRSYFARASFSDPDGNGWVLQEVTERLPGRLWDH